LKGDGQEHLLFDMNPGTNIKRVKIESMNEKPPGPI
jgi:hypothetical protein